jgi:hypothetical protein
LWSYTLRRQPRILDDDAGGSTPSGEKIAPGCDSCSRRDGHPISDRICPDVKEALEASVPNPRRLGRPSEFAELALAIISNQYLNRETIRLEQAHG